MRAEKPPGPLLQDDDRHAATGSHTADNDQLLAAELLSDNEDSGRSPGGGLGPVQRSLSPLRMPPQTVSDIGQCDTPIDVGSVHTERKLQPRPGPPLGGSGSAAVQAEGSVGPDDDVAEAAPGQRSRCSWSSSIRLPGAGASPRNGISALAPWRASRGWAIRPDRSLRHSERPTRTPRRQTTGSSAACGTAPANARDGRQYAPEIMPAQASTAAQLDAAGPRAAGPVARSRQASGPGRRSVSARPRRCPVSVSCRGANALIRRPVTRCRVSGETSRPSRRPKASKWTAALDVGRSPGPTRSAGAGERTLQPCLTSSTRSTRRRSA